MQYESIQKIEPSTLKQWLHDGSEIGLLDVREHGEYGEAHLFYAVSAAYSRLEFEIERLVPRKAVRLVLVDEDGGDLASMAAKRLNVSGYSNIYILQGGVTGWKAAGYELFAGVNLPSKTFGELAELKFHTPRISATELNEKIQRGEDLIVLDGRPYPEYRKMSIPTAICCPNGELPLRIDELVKSSETTIVINCAGRTRSIIGAQTLINLGIKNKVIALENGTQGWYLADLKLDHGKAERHAIEFNLSDLESKQKRALALAKKHGVNIVDHETVSTWLSDKNRTTFLCDVRTPEEFSTSCVTGSYNTPGGQLVQATDQFVGVRGARLVLIDDECVRAPAMASWLAMMGWDVAVLHDAVFEAPRSISLHSCISGADIERISIEKISSADTAVAYAKGAKIFDARGSMKYREGHIQNAQWIIRPHVVQHIGASLPAELVIIAEDLISVELLGIDLKELGVKKLLVNLEPETEWRAAGLEVASTPEEPADRDCLDYLFFVHDRHDGNKAAARQYLAWEMNLLAQIDEQERNSYRLPH